jgi:hypothetical protein
MAPGKNIVSELKEVFFARRGWKIFKEPPGSADIVRRFSINLGDDSAASHRV